MRKFSIQPKMKLRTEMDISTKVKIIRDKPIKKGAKYLKILSSGSCYKTLGINFESSSSQISKSAGTVMGSRKLNL